MKTFGLIGKNIDYSFSRNYFNTKFESEKINDCKYVNFDIANIEDIALVFENQNQGYNVTIPYKESIIPFLDKLNEDAQEIAAVNTIKIHKDGTLEGFNTDFYGFYKSLKPLLKPHHKKALILGTGGASKAVAFALKKLNIEYLFVSRIPKVNEISYNEISKKVFEEATIIINTTPIGTFPDVENSPDIPYSLFTENHIAYDLIYNPQETKFLQKAKEKKAIVINGFEMLVFQAEKAWEIWNS